MGPMQRRDWCAAARGAIGPIGVEAATVASVAAPRARIVREQ